ncbi:hypothetical protein Tco_1118162 [Tanacetum coccineum]
MNGWLVEDEDEVERNEVDSDLESTASSSNLKIAPNRRSVPSSSNNNENPDVATVIAQQLQAIITQVANNANNANNGNNGGGNGNDGNNGCSFKTFQSCNPKEYDGKGARGRVAAMAISWNDFKALMVEEFCPSNEMEKLENEFWNHKMSSRIKRYIAGLAPEIRGMLWATQPTTIQTAILRAGILTDEAVHCSTLTNNSDLGSGSTPTQYCWSRPKYKLQLVDF